MAAAVPSSMVLQVTVEPVVAWTHYVPEAGPALTKCCGRKPDTLPPGHRLTSDPVQCTCPAVLLLR